ncbi:hypothetical protein C0Q70_08011 [Pomacea canaliculata]|uniref:CHHC U11-48K-type domain-containing protein n=1 Tax=Pomacea canaliculata TaxID=400727 RepID=A0A2T7PGQ3_POMCA|nr:hypothetical protein C0Q70_08011 [Pomacea canaliculata]
MAEYEVPDPEDILICPYNNAHAIRAKRMQHHLVKCRKQHEISRRFVACPFNAKHEIPKAELRYHLTVCPDRVRLNEKFSHVDDNTELKGCTDVPVYTPLNIGGENWDDDIPKYTIQKTHAGYLPNSQFLRVSTMDTPGQYNEESKLRAPQKPSQAYSIHLQQEKQKKEKQEMPPTDIYEFAFKKCAGGLGRGRGLVQSQQNTTSLGKTNVTLMSSSVTGTISNKNQESGGRGAILTDVENGACCNGTGTGDANNKSAWKPSSNFTGTWDRQTGNFSPKQYLTTFGLEPDEFSNRPAWVNGGYGDNGIVDNDSDEFLIPGRPRGSLFFGCFSEIMRKEAIDPYAEWMNEMKTGIIRYYHIMGSQRVLIVDADAVKHVLVTNASNYPRPFFHFKFFTEIVGTSLLTLEGQEHHVQRRLCNSAFKLPELHPFDVITESGFGYDCNSLDDPENFFSKAFTYVLGGGKKSIDRHVRILLPKLYRYIPNEDNKMFRKSLKCLHDLIQTIISRKRKSLESKQSAGEDHKPDLLEILLSASDVETGFGFSEKQLRDHSMTFLIAGHETSATGLSWILLCLSQHPHIQHKARQEVLSVLPPRGQPITPQHLDQLAYVTCVVKETLRLYPPVPTIMREAKNDDILCGFPIPKGTIINISIGALHRNPVYWDNPEDFRPERFMNESAIPPYAYLPFISGPHMCIGHRFALLEMKLALAMLLRQFEFSPLPDVVYKKKQFITMRPYPALKLNVRCLS